MVGQTNEAGTPHRAVILGASNAARGMATIIEAAGAAVGRPLDLMAAIGHGRGYANSSCVLGRWLPAIADCGMWQALEARPPAATYALLTDIGNDLLYGAPSEQVSASVERCLQRLAGRCQQISMTSLPLEVLRAVGPRRFLLFRTLLFPRSRLTLAGALDAANELNSRLLELAERYGAVLRAPLPRWYGYDPIHIRRSLQACAWSEMLSAWPAPEGPCSLTRLPWRQRLRLRLQRPHEQRRFGLLQRREQPCCRLRDGTTISLY